jgi:Family of unknown function (DUF6232)
MLGKKQTVEVRINKHTLNVAGQIYQLRNLARVQCWKLVPARGKITYRVLRPAVLLLLGLAAINILLGASRGGVSSGLQAFDVLAVLGIGAVTFIRYARSAFRRPEYVLLLETTGYPIGVLSSRREDVIQRLVDEIAAAIENPPQSPRVIHLGDVVLGDQINQSGDSPIGKVLFGA